MKLIPLIFLLSILIISGCTQNTQAEKKEISEEYYEKICSTQIPDNWELDPLTSNVAYSGSATVTILADQYLGNSLASESYRLIRDKGINPDFEEKRVVGGKEIHEIRYSYLDEENREFRASHIFFRNQDTQCGLWLTSLESTFPSYLKDFEVFITNLKTSQSQPLGEAGYIADNIRIKQFNPEIVYLSPGYSITRTNKKDKPDIITPNILDNKKYELKIEYKNQPEDWPTKFSYTRTASNYFQSNLTFKTNKINSMIIENYTGLFNFKTKEPFQLFSIVMNNYDGEYTTSLETVK